MKRWRAESHLEATDVHAIDREREEDVRAAEDVVIEEVARLGAEYRGVGAPAAQRHEHADLALPVALAAQRQKLESLLQRELEQRAGDRRQRRRLIGMPV